MPRQLDTAAILKRLLTKEVEVQDAGANEVLDEIIGLADKLPPAESVTVTETTGFRAVAGSAKVGYCEVG